MRVLSNMLVAAVLAALAAVAGHGTADPADALEDVLDPEDGIGSGLTNIDVLASALRSQAWAQEDAPCLDAMLQTLAHAKNFTLWAVWMVDAMQPPLGQLYGVRSHAGHYDQCVSPRARAHPRHYCLSELRLGRARADSGPIAGQHEADFTVDLYLNQRTIFRSNLTIANWGLCVPRACGEGGAAAVARAALRASHLAPAARAARLAVLHCTSGTPTPQHYSTGFYIFVALTAMSVILTIHFTLYSSRNKALPDSFTGALAQACCLRRSWGELSDLKDHEMYSLNIMRIYSLIVVVAAHSLGFLHHRSLINVLDSEEMIAANPLMYHFDLMVDTFFSISGLLLVRGMCSDKWNSPLKYIWKRYVRLAAALGFVVALMGAALQHAATGPYWPLEVRREINKCKTNWWATLLMIHNIGDTRNMCDPTSWYVSCDFQLSALAAAALGALRRRPRRAPLLLAAALLAGCATSGLMSYWKNVGSTPTSGFDVYPTDAAAFHDVYIKPYTHSSSFAIGAVLGYIVYLYKPKLYRKRISQVWSAAGLAGALWAMRQCLAGGYAHRAPAPGDVWAALFCGTNRAAWSAAVCAIIAICEYGDLPLLQKALAWSPMVPISRLTYGAYLVHYPLLLAHVGSLRSLVHLDGLQCIMLTCGIVTLSFIGSLMIWLFVEAPIVNINYMLTYKTWKKTKTPTM